MSETRGTEYTTGNIEQCQTRLTGLCNPDVEGRLISRYALWLVEAETGLCAAMLGSSQEIAQRLQQARVFKDMLHRPEESLPIFKECFEVAETSLAAAPVWHGFPTMTTTENWQRRLMRIANLVEGTARYRSLPLGKRLVFGTQCLQRA